MRKEIRGETHEPIDIWLVIITENEERAKWTWTEVGPASVARRGGPRDATVGLLAPELLLCEQKHPTEYHTSSLGIGRQPVRARRNPPYCSRASSASEFGDARKARCETIEQLNIHIYVCTYKAYAYTHTHT